MDAWSWIVPMLAGFAPCFTKPSFEHFRVFIGAHMALLGTPHCVTEVMRITGVHNREHWNTPYTFLKRRVWSCLEVSQCLLDFVMKKLGILSEVILVVDDTLVKKWGRKFVGLGYFPDPTDKNPGGNRRKVLGHCWVVLGMLWQMSPNGPWVCFPLSALLFIQEAVCQKLRRKFRTKIELAKMLIQRLRWLPVRIVLVVDNLYAKTTLAWLELSGKTVVLVSRLRSNAALYDMPTPPPQGKRGRRPLRGSKVSARKLYRRRSKRRILKQFMYGTHVTIEAFVDVLMPSPTLGSRPILVVLFPQRSGKRMNILFSTDTGMDPTRLLELYAARFKVEDAFDELKTVGGFGDYRTRGLRANERHVTLTMVSYSLLRLVSVTSPEASQIETEPWWHPAGPPSVTRLRRAMAKSLRISLGFCDVYKPGVISRPRDAA